MSRIWQKSPKARVILAIFVVLALAIAAYLFFARKPRGIRDFELAQNAARKAQIETLKRDSDQDGLKDWEEAIFHTDPQAADTDTDGTQDGEEVRLGRDPLKPNSSKNPLLPNDPMATSTPLADLSQSNSINPALNITEQFSRSLLPDIVGPILLGKSPQSDELVQKVSGMDFLQNPERVWAGAKRYTPADITVSKKNGLATIAQMFLGLSQALVKHADPSHGNPGIIIDFAQNPESESAQTALLAYQHNFGNLITDITKVPAPHEYMGFILAYLNALSKMHYSLTLIANLENDPISALIAIKALPQVQEDFSRVVEQAKKESRKVVERVVKESENASQKKP